MSHRRPPPPQLQLFELRDRLVLVVGLGESGLAMARWAAHKGARVRVADTREAPARLAALREALPDGEFHAGALAEPLLEGVDLVAWSPGLSIELGDSAAFHRRVLERGIPVAGEAELFAQALAGLREGGYAPRLVAITGTNGKTTTARLVGHLCEAAGRNVRVAGNISPSMLDALREAVEAGALPDTWVLELSSFQLALAQSLRPDAATILNVTQDHLDWHATMDSYVAAKQRIYARGTLAVHNRGDALTAPRRPGPEASFGADEPARIGDFGIVSGGGLEWLAEAVPADDGIVRRRKDPVPVMVKRLMPADALQIRGRHNQLNALAALALARAVGVPMGRMLHGLRSYRGEAHRCELVARIDEVDYYDDSKGTNVGATAAALEGLGKRVVLIAGGEGKGQDFAPLAEPARRHARAVLLIGRDAERLREALAASGVPIELHETLERAVQVASALARPGDAVLLSPACASFDMFRDYAHRAEVFVAAVRALAEEAGVPC